MHREGLADAVLPEDCEKLAGAHSEIQAFDEPARRNFDREICDCEDRRAA
jgi:hypothetical protein